jgi:hypothetical protein
MTRKQKIGLGLILLGILILLAILLFPRPAPAPSAPVDVPVSQPVAAEQPVKTVPEQPAIPTPQQPTAAPAVAPEPADGRTSLARLAASFTERYGSYSNHNNFENLRDLEALMSRDLADETEAYIREQGLASELPDYVGVSTRALKPTITFYDESAGLAKATVSTHRMFSDDRLVYQDAYLEFVRLNEKWLVSSVRWDDKQEAAR